MRRREFLAGAGVGLALGSAFSVSPAAAIEPLHSPGEGGPLSLSLSAYSMRSLLTAGDGGPASMDLLGFVDYCRSLGVPGAELTSYYFPPGFGVKPGDEHAADEAYLRTLKRACHVAGVQVSGGAIRNDFCVPESDRPREVDHFRRWAEVYASLGAAAVRVFGGKVPRGVDEADAASRCVAALGEVTAIAEAHGLFAALENHGGVTTNPGTMLGIVHAVESPWFGVNFDSGNFVVDDPYAALARIAPYAVNAQIKIEMRRPDGSRPEADLARVVGILRDAGYGGWVALEYEGADDPREAVPRWLDVLRPLLGA